MKRRKFVGTLAAGLSGTAFLGRRDAISNT